MHGCECVVVIEDGGYVTLHSLVLVFVLALHLSRLK